MSTRKQVPDAACAPGWGAEGSGSRGGKRRHCYDLALGEARETLANLEVAAAVGYMPNIDAGLRRQLNQIIGTLVNIVR